MIPDETKSQNVIKGGYFNVSTKPADPKVDSISNWGTISNQNSANTNREVRNNTKPASKNK